MTCGGLERGKVKAVVHRERRRRGDGVASACGWIKNKGRLDIPLGAGLKVEMEAGTRMKARQVTPK
jgi:hypothetical protein